MNYSDELRNARADVHGSVIGNAGKLLIYDGIKPTPGGAGTTLGAEFVLGTPFAPGAIAGVVLPTFPADVVGLANIQATWFRITKAGGTWVMDGTVGVELLLNNINIQSGAAVSITAWTIVEGNS